MGSFDLHPWTRIEVGNLGAPARMPALPGRFMERAGFVSLV
jgi:hypothetical protein